MRKEKGNPKEIKALMDLAEDDLKHAHFDINEGFNRQAIVSAYYVVLSSSRALLLEKGFLPKSHSGVLNMLNLHVIKMKILPKNYGAKISELFEERLNANYNARRDFTAKEAKDAVEFAEEFLQKVKKIIKE